MRPTRNGAQTSRAFRIVAAAATALLVVGVAAALAQETQPAAASTGLSSPYPFDALVILPAKFSNNDKFGLTIPLARPVMEIAVDDVVRLGIQPPGYLRLHFADSRYSSAPLVLCASAMRPTTADIGKTRCSPSAGR